MVIVWLTWTATIVLGDPAVEGSGFGVMPVVSTNPHFDSKWFNTPTEGGVDISLTSEVYRGEKFSILLFSDSVAVDPSGSGHMTYDIEIIAPDGKPYHTSKALTGVKGPVAHSGVVLAEETLGVFFDPEDPFGVYKIRITAHDHIGGQEATDETEVELIEYGSDREQLDDEEVKELFHNYYRTHNSHHFFEFLKVLRQHEDRTDLPFLIAVFASQVLEDQPYLVPHFAEHVKQAEGAYRSRLLLLVKAVTIKQPELLPRFELADDELEELQALEFPDIWDDRFTTPTELDMLWADFFATGRVAPIRQIVRATKLREPDADRKEDAYQQLIGRAAIWSLTANCRQHDLVRAYCVTILQHDQELDPFVRAALADCLKQASKQDVKQPEAVEEPAGSAGNGGSLPPR